MTARGRDWLQRRKLLKYLKPLIKHQNNLSEMIIRWPTKKEGKDQESILSGTTPGPGYQRESDNFTIRHHKRQQICSVKGGVAICTSVRKLIIFFSWTNSQNSELSAEPTTSTTPPSTTTDIDATNCATETSPKKDVQEALILTTPDAVHVVYWFLYIYKSNLARGKIFTASIGSVDSLYPSVFIYCPNLHQLLILCSSKAMMFVKLYFCTSDIYLISLVSLDPSGFHLRTK